VRTGKSGWNRDAIRRTLEEKIGAALHRDPGQVTIGRTASGSVTFDGFGLTGRDMDIDAAADLTVSALEQGVAEIMLPSQSRSHRSPSRTRDSRTWVLKKS